MTELLKDLIERGEKHARRILLKRHEPELMPLFHLVTPGKEDILLPCSFRDDAEKDMMVAVVKATSQMSGAIACLFISEAWMAELKTPEGLTPEQAEEYAEDQPRPSQQPNRIEVVQLMATDGEAVYMRSLQMIRNKAGKVVGLSKRYDDHSEQGGMEFRGRMIDGIIQKRVIN